MALKTAQEWAELIEVALTNLITGQIQSYSLGGRSFTRYNLSELQKLYDYWREQAERADTGIITLADVRGPIVEEE